MCMLLLDRYDVLIDEDLRPWLLEVNASPSLARETALDARIKNALVRDTVRLVDPPIFDRAAVARVLKRRLVGRVERYTTHLYIASIHYHLSIYLSI